MSIDADYADVVGNTAEFRLRHLVSQAEIDTLIMTLERSMELNQELRKAGSDYRWMVESDDDVLQTLFG